MLVRSVSRNGKSSEQAVIPRALQPEILRAFNDDPTGGHLSRDKMLGKIRERYFWLGQTDDVKRHCRCCLDCQNLNHLIRRRWPPFNRSHVLALLKWYRWTFADHTRTQTVILDTFWSSQIILQNGLKLSRCQTRKRRPSLSALNSSSTHLAIQTSF